MFKHRYLRYAVILMFIITFVGCASLERKFSRKKNKEEDKAPAIITATYDYSKDRRIDELYKKYFLFWKSWQSELIDRMDATHKKRVDCYANTMESLKEMKKYLKKEKEDKLQVIIAEIQSIEPSIDTAILSENKKYNIIRLLEKTKREIENNFSYSDVKDSLEFKE